ncbi:MAG: CDP-alcohol phosphatidyltransferase family protein [Clostridia bacterium]|nr:CDP-alcohol phosphatidyltransferase family protein [Clostridia bacterium]
MDTNKENSTIFTIPNLLSFFRLVLIPFIVLAYFSANSYTVVGLLALSGLTDVVDGIIARKFNMVSTLGKILDPIADKLTQGAVIFCLALKYQWMRSLIILFIVKEVTMGSLGLIIIKKFGEINSAKWYGKANTVILYIVMGLLLLLPKLNLFIVNGLILFCAFSLLFALIMYIRFYLKIWKKHSKQD